MAATTSATTFVLPTSPAHARTTSGTPNLTKFIHSHEPLFQKKPPTALGFLRSPDGREAGLRILQYTLRLLAYIRARSFRTPVFRLLGVVSILSAIRRVVALVDLSTFFYRSYLPALNPLNLFARKPDVKGKGRAVDGIRRPRPWRLDDLLRLSRTGLDIGATVADCTFLLARLSLLPLSKRSTRRADRIADYTTLLSSLIGLAQVAHSRSQVWDEGRTVRKGAIALEQRLEEFEFWAKGEGEASLVEEKAEKEREERRLRERVRGERKKLKRLREELNELWWERLRLTAEGVFATWDVLELSISGSEGVKALSGFASASIMASQAWYEYAPAPHR